MNYYKFLALYKRDVFFSSTGDLNYDALEEGAYFEKDTSIKYTVDQLDSDLLDYDILPTLGAPLVSKKFKREFEQLLSSDCQFVPATIVSSENGNVENSFYALNVLKIIPCLDFSKSEVRPLLKNYPDGPFRIDSLYVNPVNLQGIHMCKMQEANPMIIVDETFADLCKKNKIKGIGFVKQGNQLRPEFLEYS